VARRSDRQESGGGGPFIHSGGHRGSPVGFGRQTLTPMAPSPQLLPRSRFAGDSPLEEGGFEPSVPLAKRAGLFSGTGTACIVSRLRPTEDKRADRLSVFCSSMM
jgi:hypothetical protein